MYKGCKISNPAPFKTAENFIWYAKPLFIFVSDNSLSSTEVGGGGGGRVVRWCWVNFQCRGVLLIWIRVGQGHDALAVGAGGGCLDIFSLVFHFSFLSPSLGDGPI